MKLNEVHFLVTAFVLHLTLPVAAYVAPEAETPIGPALPAEPEEVDVEVTDLSPQPRDEGDPEPSGEPDAPSDGTPGRQDAQARPKSRVRSAPKVLPAPSANPNASPLDQDTLAGGKDADGPEVPDEYTLPPGERVGGPGGDGKGPLWAMDGIVPEDDRPRPAPTSAPKRRHDKDAGSKAIAEELRKKDSALGLDLPAAGAIRGVLRSAVYASETPYECTASLTVTLSGAGRVTAVSLNTFSGGSAGAWQNVRRLVLAELKGVSFPMKSAYKKGAIIGYFVASSKKTPGGGAELDGTTFRFDVADIGTRATRQVKVTFHARPAE